MPFANPPLPQAVPEFRPRRIRRHDRKGPYDREISAPRGCWAFPKALNVVANPTMLVAAFAAFERGKELLRKLEREVYLQHLGACGWIYFIVLCPNACALVDQLYTLM